MVSDINEEEMIIAPSNDEGEFLLVKVWKWLDAINFGIDNFINKMLHRLPVVDE